MKKTILVVVITLMVSWTVFDLVNSKEETANQENTTKQEDTKIDEAVGSEETGLAIGNIAPDFELTTLEGKTARLSDYRGQRVFINFWATWCPPCRAEMPDMQKLYEQKDVDVEILAVNLQESEEVVSEFVTDFGLTFPILMDVNSDVADTYQVRAYPTSYMIDSSGRIQYIAIGAMNHDLMVQEIEKMK
ncbi:redoxin domain-containing protein [Paenisporosarcina sp. TG-14]|uniref:redoxin domain-containing protein n=1 Tax=Paenisporosarcina sp. TG-14 TaxID=1231057 RepID=UPI0002E8875C|nr:redoxin domain-containing protein [Paenisporosarcina sp. TG-14]